MIIRRPSIPVGFQLSISSTFQGQSSLKVGLPEVPSEELRVMAGHHTRVGLGNTLAQTISAIDSDKTFGVWQGMVIYRRWHLIETAKGVYDFDFIDDVIAALVAATDAGHPGGRKFGFRVQDRVFNNTNPAATVPQYLIDEGLTFVDDVPTTRAGAALWRKTNGVFKCMNYNIALHKAVLDHMHPTLGAKLRDLPNFVIMYGEESTYGFATSAEQNAVGYNRQDCIDSEIYRASQLRAYEPRIGWAWLTNFINNDTSLLSYMRQWFDRAPQGVYFSTGPDVNQNPQGRKVLLGLQVGGGVDYRNVPGHPVLEFMEQTWDRSPTVQSAADIYPRLAQNNAQSIVWSRVTSGANLTPEQLWTGATGVRAYIDANPTWPAQPDPITYDFDAGAAPGSYTYIDKSSYVRGATGALAITAPTRQAGDLLLLHASSNADAETFNGPPSGWTQLYASGGGIGRKIALMGRVATGDASDDITYDFWSGVSGNGAQIAVLRPSSTVPSLATIVHASAHTVGNGLGMPMPARTIGVNGALVLGMVRKVKMTTEDAAVLTQPSWMTDAIHEVVRAGNFQEIYAWGYTQQSEAEDIAADQWSQSIDNSELRRGVVVALVAPSPGGPAIVASSGKGTTSVTDGTAMGGTYLRYNANAPNDFITFEFNAPVWATYKIKIRHRTASNFGRVQLAIDGANFGDIHDFFVTGTDLWYPGDKMLTAGLHQFKFTIVGKNLSASDYRIGLDYITLEP